MTNDFIVDTKSPKSTREVLPAGSYQATLYWIVDLWTQYSPMYDNRQHKIRLSFELPTELRTFQKDKGEQPMAIHKEYTLSFSEKANLRKDLMSWRWKDIDDWEFNLWSMIWQSCLLSIWVKDWKENQYNTINWISWLVKGMTAPQMINIPLVWRIADWTEWATFQSLPEFLQKKIRASFELNPNKDEEEHWVSEVPF